MLAITGREREWKGRVRKREMKREREREREVGRCFIIKVLHVPSSTRGQYVVDSHVVWSAVDAGRAICFTFLLSCLSVCLPG